MEERVFAIPAERGERLGEVFLRTMRLMLERERERRCIFLFKKTNYRIFFLSFFLEMETKKYHEIK